MKILYKYYLLLFIVLFSCDLFMEQIYLDPNLFGKWVLGELTNIVYFNFTPNGELFIYNDSNKYKWKIVTNKLAIWIDEFWRKSDKIYFSYNTFKEITNIISNSKNTNFITNYYLLINNVRYIKIE